MDNKMETREVALRLSGVKKMYKLGQIGGGTLTADLQSWWARKRGKEDPNTKIGEGQRSNGETFMALNGIDLTIYKGEAVGIIGSNGAGKSTLLKLLSRVTAPTEGEIDLYGRVASMLEVGTGFHGEMTGRENVYLNGAILGMSRAEIDAKMEDIIEFSEVREFIDTPVKRYSSGMYVKLAFSVAAHLDSEIMIMDEVLAVGDVNFQQKCLAKMRDVAKKEGRTVLYVSHNMNTIRQLCDRCIVLNQGKVVFEGNVEEAIQIYMQSNSMPLRSEYNVSRAERLPGITGDCHLNRVLLESSVLQLKNPLRFMLEISSKKTITSALLRYVLFSANGTTIGTTYSAMFDLNIGKNEPWFEFDATLLAPGRYFVDLIIISYDGESQVRHDIVRRAFSFEINESDILYNMEWNKVGWGNIHFAEIRSLGDNYGKD